MSQPSPELDKLATSLSGVSPDQYGAHYREHVLELYKVYLEMADKISERREKANSFFLALNAALIAVLAKDALGPSSGSARGVEVIVPVAAIVLCYLWHRIVRSYRDLNSAKFKVIHGIERLLPLRPYDAEWEMVDRGRNPDLYLPFTHIEIIVPWVFMCLHAIMTVYAMCRTT